MPPDGASSALRLVHITTVPETLLFLSGQAAYSQSRGVRVCAISSPGAELQRFGETEGVQCFAVPMERGIAPGRDLVALARLWRLLRRLRPDIVDAHTPKGGLLGVTAAWLAGVPVRIYHLHGLRFFTVRGARRLLLVFTERVACSLATRVICVSRSVAVVAATERLAARRKLTVLLGGSISGVDATGRFRPAPDPAARRVARASLGIPPDAHVIGYVGRLVPEKGIVELAAAWHILREEMPDLWLVLVGPEEDQNPMPEAVMSALRSDPRVLLAGLDRDTPKYYRSMDLVAFPTYCEGFGIVLLEAAAMALPVVGTRVPGCVDAIADGVTGTLVPPRDARALADAIRVYLHDPALRRRHGAAGRARVLEEFEPKRFWEALHEEYVRLATGAPLSRRPNV